ncbi:hypothetical protein OTU49_014073 [Cherax quadricarinatus]|uniref:Uncharacterized protein n=1 Tax=Cherax quadricarinatus TaxID=27406 RepID=A0AAW0VSV2_CHEQU
MHTVDVVCINMREEVDENPMYNPTVLQYITSSRGELIILNSVLEFRTLLDKNLLLPWGFNAIVNVSLTPGVSVESVQGRGVHLKNVTSNICFPVSCLAGAEEVAIALQVNEDSLTQQHYNNNGHTFL